MDSLELERKGVQYAAVPHHIKVSLSQVKVRRAPTASAQQSQIMDNRAMDSGYDRVGLETRAPLHTQCASLGSRPSRRDSDERYVISAAHA